MSKIKMYFNKQISFALALVIRRMLKLRRQKENTKQTKITKDTKNPELFVSLVFSPYLSYPYIQEET